MRYAIYLTPGPDAALTRCAEAWLGRSAFGTPTGTPTAPPEADPATPARYGFHATMRAPFRLREGADEAALRAAFAAFARRMPAPEPTLAVARLHRFVALVARDPAPLAAAADATLRHFEPLRAPLQAADRERRNPAALDERGRALLEKWGYPLVEERFRFHMTLSGPMDAATTATVEAAARAHFAPLLDRPHRLLYALLRETEPQGPFTVITIQDEQST